MKNLSQLNENNAPKIEIPLNTPEEFPDSVELEPLRKLDWAQIDKALDRSVKVKIMEVQADMEDLDIDEDEDVDLDDPEVREIALKFQEKLDDAAQVEMYYHGLKRVDSDLDRKKVDYIITHCIDDPEQFQRGTWWLFNGVDPSEVQEELADTGDSGNPESEDGNEDTEDERLISEE